MYDLGYDSWDSEDEHANAAALQRAEGRYERLLDAYIAQYRQVADRAALDVEAAINSGQEALAVDDLSKPVDPILAPYDARTRANPKSSRTRRSKSKDKDKSTKSKDRSTKDKSKGKDKE